MNEQVTNIVGIVLAVCFVTAMLLEWLLVRMAKQTSINLPAYIINLSVAAMQQFTDILNKAIFIGVFVWVQQHYALPVFLGFEVLSLNWPVTLTTTPPYVQLDVWLIIAALLVLFTADFLQYWLHRLSHEVNFLWAGHVTHHSSSSYDYSVAIRQNAIEGLYTWVFFLPLAFAGVPWPFFVSVYAFSLAWQFLVHTRVVEKLGWLEQIMATPSHHRVHHGKNPKYIDKNYGALFIIWDKLFGTFEPETEPVEYGIKQPLRDENPVWANVHHHVDIFKRLLTAASVKEAIKWLIGKPSQIYTDNQQQVWPAPTYCKQKSKVIYVLVNVCMLIGITYMALHHTYANGMYNMFMLVIMLSILMITVQIALLQNQRWADYAEVLRLVLLLIMGVGLVFYHSLGIAVVTVSVLLLTATVYIARQYQQAIT